jgi:hypothetical protein
MKCEHCCICIYRARTILDTSYQFIKCNFLRLKYFIHLYREWVKAGVTLQGISECINYSCDLLIPLGLVRISSHHVLIFYISKNVSYNFIALNVFAILPVTREDLSKDYISHYHLLNQLNGPVTGPIGCIKLSFSSANVTFQL